jgi:hypothetical protein
MHGPKLIVGAEVRRLAGRQLDAEKRRHGAARRGSAVVLPVVPNSDKSQMCESRRRKNMVGVQRVGWLIVRFHLLRPLGRLYGSTYYWMLPSIPTARASLTCPPPRRSPPPASGSTGTTGRSCIPESGKEGFRVRRARGWEGLRRRRERALVCLVSRRSIRTCTEPFAVWHASRM